MMPSSRALRSARQKHQRRSIRLAQGPLKTNVVSKTSLKRYTQAAHWFFSLVLCMGWSLGSSVIEFDEIVCAAMEIAWQDGEPMALVNNLLASLHHFVPKIKGELKGSWRLKSAWNRKQLPNRAAAIPLRVLHAIVGVLWSWNRMDAAIMCLVAYHCCLRTAEMAFATVAHVHFAADGLSAVLALPFTKGSARTGATESVTIFDACVVYLLRLLTSNLLPGDFLLRRKLFQFRRLFSAAIAALGLDHLDIKPHSLRRGGATHYFRESGSLDLTINRGRWTCARTARSYINTALADSMDGSAHSSVEVSLMAAYLKEVLVTL
jgi:hypothetical protein